MSLRIAPWFVCLQLVIACACRQQTAQFSLIPPEESGLTFRNDLTETQHNNIMTYEYSYNGGGVAIGDINGDSLPDIYFTGNTVSNKLYLNEGNLKFRDITERSGTAGRNDWKTGVTMADVNGDGWLDIYVCYSGNAPEEGYEKPVIRDHPKRSNELYINNGCEPGGIPTFTEMAQPYGLDAPGTFSTQAYFLDYDLDGDLDMFLLNHANMFYSAFLNTRRLRNLRHPYFGNKLFRNDSEAGVISFADVSDQTGIHGSGINFGLGASITDFNEDGYPDLYVTNDYEEQDFCYINNGDGTFREVSRTMFGHLSKYGMGSDIADVNNDGLPDVIVLDMLPEDNRRQKLLKGPDEYDRYSLAVDSGYHHQYMRNTLQLNRGFGADTLPRFSEIGQFAQISNTDWSWAPLFADFDNDGLKDLFVSNGFLRDFNNLDFIKYNANAYAEAKSSRRPIDYLKLVQNLPSTKIPNYIFRNEDGFRFSDRKKEWGVDVPSVSNGAAYADLDNDGDLDLVTNNLNSEAFLFRNNADLIQRNNYLKIRLHGKGANPFAVGARMRVIAGDRELLYELWPGRGYQSSVEPVLTVGLGTAEVVRELNIEWPDGTTSRLQNVKANRTLIVSQEGSTRPAKRSPAMPNNAVLTRLHDRGGIDFLHRENGYVDFKAQRLLFYQVSRLGGKFAKGDVNNDGNDDLFFTAPVGQSAALFLGQDDGTFTRAPSQPWALDSIAEDTDALFLDADNDGDLDLYVVRGGGEFVPGAPMYQDKLYLNAGGGVFSLAEDALPPETTSGGTVTAADIDQDGDLDLFVGGRLVPGQYGYIPRSFLLRNDSGGGRITFTDVTPQHAEALTSPGMVTCARFSDYNGDGWPDLILAGEWMPVRIFENREGTLTERSDFQALQRSNGWWCSILPADVDQDGDIDFLLGNAGTNMQFRASPDEPIELFAADFNHDGAVDPLVNYYIQGRSYPLATRDELLDQVSSLKKKFIRYEDYADATLQDIASETQIGQASRYAVYHLESSWLENLDGKDFSLHALPAIAQWSPVNGFVVDDLDGDGRIDILAVGNFYPFKPQLGRSDAGFGTLMGYDGGIRTQNDVRSRLWLSGDIRCVDVLAFRSGIRRVVVSRNNDYPDVFSLGQPAVNPVAKVTNSKPNAR